MWYEWLVGFLLEPLAATLTAQAAFLTLTCTLLLFELQLASEGLSPLASLTAALLEVGTH